MPSTLVGQAAGRETTENQAIEKGYAIHDPVTGDFKWKEPDHKDQAPSATTK